MNNVSNDFRVSNSSNGEELFMFTNISIMELTFEAILKFTKVSCNDGESERSIYSNCCLCLFPDDFKVCSRDQFRRIQFTFDVWNVEFY